MNIRQYNQKLIVGLEAVTVSIFLLSFVYLLDDVIQVVSLKGSLEDVVFYVFVIGPFITFPLSMVCWRKLKLKRFGFYASVSIVQLLMMIVFAYILLNSQV